MIEHHINETVEHSRIKAAIVGEYFFRWASVIACVQDTQTQDDAKRIAFIDLFAGPGRNVEGAGGVPVEVVGRAAADPVLSKRMVFVFNDRDANNTHSLEQALDGLENTKWLSHSPVVLNHDDGSELCGMFASLQGVPKFLFADPWGYKGFDLDLIGRVINDWGGDCVFFFNYHRINMGLANPNVSGHVDALFGSERAQRLRERIKGMTPNARQETILNEICCAVESAGHDSRYRYTYVLPFCFNDAGSSRAGHFLVYASKNLTGYTIMKEVMAQLGERTQEGVPSFEYIPSGADNQMLFAFSRSLDELGRMLCKTFAGERKRFEDVYLAHHIKTPFVRKNYVDEILRLEQSGLAGVENKTPDGEIGPESMICFPHLKPDSHL